MVPLPIKYIYSLRNPSLISCTFLKDHTAKMWEMEERPMQIDKKKIIAIILIRILWF